ncbi:hypothetical protein Moror_11584 [Moniliophthora roreri MCA 2997]|uniref:Uncharacterized protein n=2 Tax=Moniliophthora roreri TaxID=221103 RepID=V2Y727_MONRO|nr:hypothetical protein Moror_11584 [Moniliophthora roreri MCA 2997]KAI3621206.1 hypothetical protein WG66_014507 [Moniliophthora roreri]
MPPLLPVGLIATSFQVEKRQFHYDEDDDNGEELSEAVKTGIGVVLAIFLLTIAGFALVSLKKRHREKLTRRFSRGSTSSYNQRVIASVPPAMPRTSLFNRSTWPRPDLVPNETMMRSVDTLPQYHVPPPYSPPLEHPAHKRPGS